MAQFNIDEFEARVESLLAAYEHLLSDYHALREAHENEARRNREIRAQLSELIERIRALETETGNV